MPGELILLVDDEPNIIELAKQRLETSARLIGPESYSVRRTRPWL